MSKPNAFTAKPDLSEWTKQLSFEHKASKNSAASRPQSNDIFLPGSNLQRKPKQLKREVSRD